MPKRTKYRKQQRGKRKGVSKGGNTISFGDYALQSLESAWITNRQIEACRIAITRTLKRGGKIWIRIFPAKPFTKKPAETRMGKGKGDIEGWVVVVKPGRILFEIGGIQNEELARKAMSLASTKLPIKTRFLSRFERL